MSDEIGERIFEGTLNPAPSASLPISLPIAPSTARCNRSSEPTIYGSVNASTGFMKLEYQAGTAIDIVSEPACTDCSISGMVPSCELGKISTFILFDESFASSSRKMTIAL